jgi:hypothetical protein
LKENNLSQGTYPALFSGVRDQYGDVSQTISEIGWQFILTLNIIEKGFCGLPIVS